MRGLRGLRATVVASEGTVMTDEQQARLTKPYKEHLRERLKTADDYRGYLDACHAEGPETFALAVQDVLDFAATTMRSRCVEKVREMRSNWHERYVAADSGSREALVAKELLFARCQAANKIITAIESLPLEQGEQEKR